MPSGSYPLYGYLSKLGSLFRYPKVRHPYKKDPERDPNLENHHYCSASDLVTLRNMGS